MKGLATYIPVLSWGRTLERRNLRRDVVAALVLWSIVVPQALAYAGLAGLEASTGLWAAIAGLVAYGILGTSNVLSIGPGSATAALVAAVLLPVAPRAVQHGVTYAELAAMLALLVGAVLLVARIARLSFLIEFVAMPVAAGYMAGLGVTIIVGQIPKMFGLPASTTTYLGRALYETVKAIPDANPWAAAFGVGALVLVLGARRFSTSFPMPFFVVVGSLLLSWKFDVATAYDVPTLGSFGNDMPRVRLLDPSLVAFIPALVPGALAIGLLSYLESVTVARQYAEEQGRDLDADQELVAMSGTNIAASLVGGFPVDGSVSRTAAAAQAGVRTQLAGIVLAGYLLVTVLTLGGVLAYLPLPVLGGIVIAAVATLLDPRPLHRFWRIDRFDYVIAIASFIGVIMLGSVEGLLLGATLSLVGLAYRTHRPRLIELGEGMSEQPGGAPVRDYRNLHADSGFARVPGVAIVRMEEELYFANIRYFEREVRSVIAETETVTGHTVRNVVVDAAAITAIDGTAMIVMAAMIRRLSERGIGFVVAGAPAPVVERLTTPVEGTTALLPAREIFPTVESAVDWGRTDEGDANGA